MMVEIIDEKKIEYRKAFTLGSHLYILDRFQKISPEAEERRIYAYLTVEGVQEGYDFTENLLASYPTPKVRNIVGSPEFTKLLEMASERVYYDSLDKKFGGVKK